MINTQVLIKYCISVAGTVGNVYFKLFSTKFPGSKSLLNWENATDAEERILFDEETQTATLIENTMFDPSLKTIVTAHGNTGKLQIDRLLWKAYCEAAKNGKINILTFLCQNALQPFNECQTQSAKVLALPC